MIVTPASPGPLRLQWVCQGEVGPNRINTVLQISQLDPWQLTENFDPVRPEQRLGDMLRAQLNVGQSLEQLIMRRSTIAETAASEA